MDKDNPQEKKPLYILPGKSRTYLQEAVSQPCKVCMHGQSNDHYLFLLGFGQLFLCKCMSEFGADNALGCGKSSCIRR